MTDGSTRTVIELRAGGPEDPDAVRTATVLAAYYALERAQAFRRLWWPRLGAVSTVVCLLALMVVVPRDIVIVTLLTCAAIAVISGLFEHRRQRTLRILLRTPNNSSANSNADAVA